MVILFAAPYLRGKGENPKGGGFETYLFRVAGALKELGHTPIILSIGTRNRSYVEDGIEIIFAQSFFMQFGSRNFRRIGQIVQRSLAINRKIREILQERKIDIIQFPSINGLSLCYHGKVPAVMRLSSYTKIYNKGLSKIERNICALCEQLAAMRCNAVFAPSNVVADAFSQDIHRTVSVIESPFWNDCVICDNSVYNEKLSGKKYFLFFGNLGIDKGILVIAECLQNFFQSHPEYYFVCCGMDMMIHGRSAVHILKEAAGKYKERFLYMKTLPHKTLYPIVQQADFVICPSCIENFSNTCMEAMYFERIVIGTDGASFEQLIDDGVSGFLCTPGNAESLLEKMEKAATLSDMQRAEMGKKARKRIDRLAPEFAVEKLLRYYQYVIAHVNK